MSKLTGINFEEVKKVVGKDGSTVVHYSAKIDGVWYSVPMNDETNRYYAEIKKQVDAGTLTIKDAD